MHDWTLLSILFEWKSGQVTLEFRKEGPELAKIIAHGVVELHVPRLNEWGPSVSVNKVLGPSDRGSSRCELEIEMQSGDHIRIVAKSFDFPRTAQVKEDPHGSASASQQGKEGQLEDEGFVVIGRITLVGNRFVVHFDRPEARSWGPAIYAFRIGGEVVRIGKRKSDLRSRMRQWEGHVSDALRGIFHVGGTNPWEAFEWRRRLTQYPCGEFLARRGSTDEEKALIGRYNPPLCNDSPSAKLRPPEARGVRDVAAAEAYWRWLNNPSA